MAGKIPWGKSILARDKETGEQESGKKCLNKDKHATKDILWFLIKISSPGESCRLILWCVCPTSYVEGIVESQAGLHGVLPLRGIDWRISGHRLLSDMIYEALSNDIFPTYINVTYIKGKRWANTIKG